MTANLDQVLVKKFENEAIQAFQESGSHLRDAVTVRDATGASQVQFQVYGDVEANERTAIHTPVVYTDPTLTPATATVKNYLAAIPTDIFKNNQVGFDARQSAVQALVSAMNRRLDQVIIDALDAHSFTNTVAKDVSGTADNLNTAMFAAMAESLGSKVPDTDRHVLCHDKGFYHFIQEGDVKDIQISMRKALAEGMLPDYTGIKIHKIADRNEGGLTLSTNDRTNYFWQKTALGLAINMTPKVSVEWSTDHDCWVAKGRLSAGAVVIQGDGVGKLTTDES